MGSTRPTSTRPTSTRPASTVRPGPTGPGQYGPGQYGPGQYGPGQYPPGGQLGPDGSPGADQKRPLTFGKITLPRSPLVPAIVVVALVVIAATAVVLSSSSSPGSAPGKGGGGGATATASASTSTSTSGAASPMERQAATQLSGLLTQSGTDHGAVVAAVGDVQSCGKDLAKDARVFSKSAANRDKLLAKLAQLPGRSALPAAMVSDLMGAWKASASVDTDLAKWASHAATAGCHGGDQKYPSYQASLNDDHTASADKQSFVSHWNSLAKKDGLPTYQSAQL